MQIRSAVLEIVEVTADTSRSYYFISFPKPCLEFRKGKIPDDSLKKHVKNCVGCKNVIYG